MNNYLKHPFILSLSGANGSGKTNLIKYIIKSFVLCEKLNIIVIFSNTGGFTDDFKFLDELNNIKYFIINPVFYEDAIKKILDIQRKKAQSGGASKCFIIFDDILGAAKDSKILKVLISQNRHFNLSVIFSVQHINQAATYLREISNYDIIFELKTSNSLKACYENYFACDYKNFNDFKFAMNKLLKKYHFLFADKATGEKKIMIAPLT